MSVGDGGGSSRQGGTSVIIGAGPAGLTAAYELSKSRRRSIVLEREDAVGGLARTLEFKGYLFDIGGHRVLTSVAPIEKTWREILGEEFFTRPRLSLILFRSKFFNYPLDPGNALAGFGIVVAMRSCLS